MDIEITMFWAGLFAILFIYLAFQTALARTRETSVGEGSKKKLLRFGNQEILRI